MPPVENLHVNKNLLLHTVESYYPKLPQHGFITDIHSSFFSDPNFKSVDFYTLWIKPSKEIVLINPETGKQEKELTEDMYYELFGYVVDNQHTLTLRDSVIEHLPIEEKKWKMEPENVLGSDDMCIGKVAIAKVEESEDGVLYAPLFISADKTWSTLTMYAVTPDASTNNLSRNQAKADLLAIAKSLINLAEKL